MNFCSIFLEICLIFWHIFWDSLKFEFLRFILLNFLLDSLRFFWTLEIVFFLGIFGISGCHRGLQDSLKDSLKDSLSEKSCLPLTGQDAEAGHQITAAEHSGADEQRLLAVTSASAAVTSAAVTSAARAAVAAAAVAAVAASAAAAAAAAAAARPERRRRNRNDRRGDLLVAAAVVAQRPETGHQEQQPRHKVNHLRHDNKAQQVTRMLVTNVTHPYSSQLTLKKQKKFKIVATSGR